VHMSKPAAVKQSKDSDAAKNNPPPAKKPPDDKVLALRSALRSAPRKRVKAPRSPLKAAVAQVLPDLLAFRAKGYSGAELATVMREHGFVISARTLTRYIAELRAGPPKRDKKKTPPAKPKTEAAPQAERVAPKALTPTLSAQRPPVFVPKPLLRRKANDILGHRFDDDV